ncbi:Drug Metabolite transporter superfamily [Micractinium conductrix]|uniref:Drug Metabolite transporter superfamily n=1 Tax=Micractinium conductrix TaxID=554055 RepID=A0A2P6VCW3_9CHLO|nr:Drug Metabolite transporter superfamily [Micractinium conductrix]|eukprot:PSC71928.1 Drug Metabolite transporter superfamily [Micractinium conductrix]
MFATRRVQFGLMVLAYLGLNSSLNLLNKWSLGVYGFRFPFLLTSFANAAMMTFSGKLLSEKLDVVRLTFYTAPVSLAYLLPLTLVYERKAFLRYLPVHYSGAVFIIALTSINAVCYNLVSSLQCPAGVKRLFKTS